MLPEKLTGALEQEPTPAPLPGAVWYRAQAAGDGLLYRFPAGALAGASYLTADLLLDGARLAVFGLLLQEGEDGPAFGLGFGLLNQCQARLRMPLEAVNQNRWLYDRESALLKPSCFGERVDLCKVDRIILRIERKSDQPVRWCMTPVSAVVEEPPRLEKPLLPKGLLLDELGQNALYDWPGKSHSADEVTGQLLAQQQAALKQRWPGDFSRWGGWLGKQVEATGFFRTQRDGQRWWLVDPEGYVFWSSGLDCFTVDTEMPCSGLETALAWLPDQNGPYHQVYRQHYLGQIGINYLAANLIRAFGPENWHEQWAAVALAELRRLGFNTVGNWSDWRVASRGCTPYVRPLDGSRLGMKTVYRDFPDVFHPDFEQAAASFAEQLRESADDPAMIGYFLMNEPTWGFAQETPAAGMLFNTPSCASRAALAKFLSQRYAGDAALSTAWGIAATLAAVQEGAWTAPLTPAAQKDLADFSSIMVEKFFGGLSAACRAVDAQHLNLGIRYYTIPPEWALAGMRHFDVFSMNCYRQRLPAEEMGQISAMLNQPIMIGEWHFGALDAGLPASGIGHVPDQASRGKAFRVYLEDAAAKSWCVGVHYFIMYDQSALGRFDGENYNIGFLDVCNRPYEPLAQAARASHERLYQVASGAVLPYNDEPAYLPLLFM